MTDLPMLNLVKNTADFLASASGINHIEKAAKNVYEGKYSQGVRNFVEGALRFTTVALSAIGVALTLDQYHVKSTHHKQQQTADYTCIEKFNTQSPNAGFSHYALTFSKDSTCSSTGKIAAFCYNAGFRNKELSNADGNKTNPFHDCITNVQSEDTFYLRKKVLENPVTTAQNFRQECLFSSDVENAFAADKQQALEKCISENFKAKT